MQESLDTSSLKDDACIAVGLDVISCENEEDELLAIGKYMPSTIFEHVGLPALQSSKYYATQKVLQTVRKYKGSTPVHSLHASRPPFDTRKAMIMEMIVEKP